MDLLAKKMYADLIVRIGANVQRGQEVVIYSQASNLPFVRLVAEACYEAGAAAVSVQWSDTVLEELAYRWQSQERLNTLTEWEIARVKHTANVRAATIHLISDTHSDLREFEQKKMVEAVRCIRAITRPIEITAEGFHAWCVAAVPGERWARQVFPDMETEKAVEQLWQAVLRVSRADHAPVEAWKQHIAQLQRRCAFLNTLDIASLHYRAANGTDLTVGLISGAVFKAGIDRLPDGTVFCPNIPTEECYTTPMRGKAEGIVYSSKPFVYQGQIVDRFWMRFQNGRVVESYAEENNALLQTLLRTDEGAAYLGECALVPYESPINQSNILFHNTLFDENACCHLAFGHGFNFCLAGYEKLTQEEVCRRGVNQSDIHIDFMIGTRDLEITAQCRNGERRPIFQKGAWAF